MKDGTKKNLEARLPTAPLGVEIEIIIIIRDQRLEIRDQGLEIRDRDQRQRLEIRDQRLFVS